MGYIKYNETPARESSMEDRDLYIAVFKDQQQMEACQASLMEVGVYIILKSRPLTLIVDVEAFDAFRKANGEESYNYATTLTAD